MHIFMWIGTFNGFYLSLFISMRKTIEFMRFEEIFTSSALASYGIKFQDFTSKKYVEPCSRRLINSVFQCGVYIFFIHTVTYTHDKILIGLSVFCQVRFAEENSNFKWNSILFFHSSEETQNKKKRDTNVFVFHYKRGSAFLWRKKIAIYFAFLLCWLIKKWLTEISTNVKSLNLWDRTIELLRQMTRSFFRNRCKKLNSNKIDIQNVRRL